MFGLKRAKADIETLKIKVNKLNDRVAHLESEKKERDNQIAALIEVVARDGAVIKEDISLLKGSLVKPKKKVGRPRKVVEESKPKPKKKNEQKG